MYSSKAFFRSSWMKCVNHIFNKFVTWDFRLCLSLCCLPRFLEVPELHSMLKSIGKIEYLPQ